MSDPIGRGRPREKSGSRPGPSVPGVRGDVGGNAASHYKRRALPIAKGRSRVERFCAPAPLPKCPHTRKEKISNSDDEIAACLGRVAHRGGVPSVLQEKAPLGRGLKFRRS